MLPEKTMEKMMEIYVPEDADPDDIRLNPGRAKDLTGFPPVFMATAEFDPLRSDSEEFARRLEEAGVEVEYKMMDGMMHGFVLYWQRFHRVEELIREIGDKVKSL